MTRATLLSPGARCSRELNMSGQITTINKINNNSGQGILQQIPNRTSLIYFVPAKQHTIYGTVQGNQ